MAGPDGGRSGSHWPSDAASSDDHGVGVRVEDVLPLKLQVDVTDQSEWDPLQCACVLVLHRGKFTEIDVQGLTLDEKCIAMCDPGERPKRVLLRRADLRLDPRHHGGRDHQGTDQ